MLSINIYLKWIVLSLPILWSLGVLPLIDVLILWVLEQVQIFGFGGSPAASDSRLFQMLGMSLFSGALVRF
jgi:hypothetical protein